jgi:Ca-activated chloride channel family protein
VDRHDRVVNGLGKSDFIVLDNDNPALVKYFSGSDEPASFLVVFDASASMESKITNARNAVNELLAHSNAQDEFGLITVDTEPHIAVAFGEPVAKVQQSVDAAQARGRTALWDGLYLGLQQMESGRWQKKAIIVVSDGGDNHSRYTEPELRRFLDEAGVRLYAMVLGGAYPAAPRARSFGVFNPYAEAQQEQEGAMQLESLSEITGGRLFAVNDAAQISAAAAQLSREIHNEYVLAFPPRPDGMDGKWHKLRVRLSSQAPVAQWHTLAKKGYYAPLP